MPQPANRRTGLPSISAERSAMPELAVAVGVHPADRAGVAAAVHALDLGDQLHRHLGGRAADGGRGVQAPRPASSTVAPSESCTTPATSVARCITLGRCSTNGTSGTFIEEQCGASDSATERTAYSCSSRSLEDAGQLPGERQVALVVARTPDRAGQHPRGDQAALATYEHLRRRAEEPVDVEGPAHLVRRRQPAQRPAHVDVGRRRWPPGRARARPSPGRRRRSATRRRRRPTPRPCRSSRRRRR